MGSLRNVITLQSKPADLSPLTAAPLPCRLPDYAACAPQHRDAFVPIPQADAAKYQPEDKCYTKILVNGQEPDTRGVRSVNENGRVWGAVLCILERLQTVIPGGVPIIAKGIGDNRLHSGAAANGYPRCLLL